MSNSVITRVSTAIVFSLVATVGLSMSRSPSAYALLATIAGPGAPGFVVSGLVFGGMGGALYAQGDPEISGSVGKILLGLGFLFLDANTVKFAPLSEAQSATFPTPLTPEELVAYNSNLDEINVVAESVADDLVKSKKMTSEYAKARWEVYAPSLNPAAYSAIKKVAAAASSTGETASKVRK